MSRMSDPLLDVIDATGAKPGDRMEIRGFPGRLLRRDYPHHVRYVHNVVQFEDKWERLIVFVSQPLTEDQEDQIATAISAGRSRGEDDKTAEIRRVLGVRG